MTGWAWAALGLYLVWLVAAFGVRSLVQRRLTGDTGFRGLSGSAGSAAWWAGVLFVVALLGAVAAPLAALAGLRGVVEDASVVYGVGTAITIVGILGTLVAQRAMGTSWRVGVDADERTELVTNGAFAYVRNPIFTAMAFTGLGLTLMVPNAVALIALAALAVAVELQVRVVEEPYLRRTHGDAYVSYARRSGRFVPKVGLINPK
ncbi:methyltransferase family protein [Streptomyces rochei]|uniref:methyltransferase family protein n=1 Tax=Streptomyces rochei TaxID=1928 RepID=UPI0033B55502